MSLFSAANRLVVARGVRGFADGAVTVLLARHLITLGFSAAQSGALMTATLLGSAATTLALGLVGHRLPPRTVLLFGSALMFFTGLGFLTVTWFWLLFVVAIVGTLNPSTGDVSFLLPTEQAALGSMAFGSERVGLYARYAIAGRAGVALGALTGGLAPQWTEEHGLGAALGLRAGFVFAMGAAVLCLALYLGLKIAPPATPPPKVPLQKSRGVVMRLALAGPEPGPGGADGLV